MNLRMKNLLCLLLALSLLFGLVGCKGGQRKVEKPADEVADKDTADVETAEDPAADSETAEADKQDAEADEQAAEAEEDPAAEANDEAKPAETTEPKADSDEETENESEATEEAKDTGEKSEESAAEDTKDSEAPADEEPATDEQADTEADEESSATEKDDEAATEEPKDDATEAEKEPTAVQKLSALTADEAAQKLLDEGFKVYDVTKVKPLDVKRAIFAANYDPQKLMTGFKYLLESGLLDNVLPKKPEKIGDVDFAELLSQIPIDAVLNYLSSLKVNFYNVFYMSFDDVQAAEKAFYTGQGIIALNEQQKQAVGAAAKKARQDAPEIQKELRKIFTKFIIDHPKQAEAAIKLLQDMIAQLSQPEWIVKEEGRLVRRISLELPMGTIFIEEAQRDEHLFLLLSYISNDDGKKIQRINDILNICEELPVEFIAAK